MSRHPFSRRARRRSHRRRCPWTLKKEELKRIRAKPGFEAARRKVWTVIKQFEMSQPETDQPRTPYAVRLPQP